MLVLGAVWWPQFAHDYVPTPSISEHTTAVARSTPDDTLLRELVGFMPGFGLAPRSSDRAELVTAADKLLGGHVDIPGLPRMSIVVPFSGEDIDKGPGTWQLAFAGLTLPEVLIRAYQLTHDDRYLFGARDMIVGWAEYERHAWISRGFLWNDHAMAARVAVLAEFWLVYRHHAAFDPAVARTLLTFVARTGYVLANPAHFTFKTNHGVMQNLALWHLVLAFPMLPEAGRYRDTAFTRLRQQMGFYIDSEGVVLEHSAGYHSWGVQFLGMALRYLALMHMPPPPEWVEKYKRADLVYAQIRLPHGFLPLIGDTENAPDRLGPMGVEIGPDGQARALRHKPFWRPGEPRSLYPLAGYSIWWDGLEHWPQPRGLSQTVVTWSYFPGHGHKHADELSVLVWASGERWWSNVGYWNYGEPGRSQVESWSGSNAPHLVTESVDSERSSQLVASGSSARLAVVDLERRGPKHYVVRRQVVHLASNLWIVLDHAMGAADSLSRTQWTTSPNIRMVPGQGRNSYLLQSEDTHLSMSMHFLTSPGTSVRQVQGSFEPFAGWQVVESKSRPAPAPAPALIVDQPARDAWAIAVSCLAVENSAAVPCPARIDGHFSDDTDWILTLHTRSARLAIRRADSSIHVDDGQRGGSSQALVLETPDDVRPRREELQRAYAAVAAQYPRFKEVPRYRVRVSLGVLVLLIVQETAFALPTPLRRRGVLLRALSIGGWTLLGMWLVVVYFR